MTLELNKIELITHMVLNSKIGDFSSGQGNATEFLNIQSDGSEHQRHSYIHMVYIRTPPQSTTIRPGPGLGTNIQSKYVHQRTRVQVVQR